jgi:hypothetical protein
MKIKVGTGYEYDGYGYEYDGYVFVAWVLQVRRAEVVTNDQPVSGHGPLFYGNYSRIASI